MSTLYLLFESSSGYGLFERVKAEVIEVSAAQKDINDLKKFSEIVKLKSFLPFTSAENALENINAVSEGEATQFLLDWLQLSLPKPGKKAGYELGVLDSRLAAHIKDTLSTNCVSTQLTDELLRGVRLHFTHYIKALKASDLHQAQLGLSHAYSRSKVKFNVHRVDNMIIQAIALLDQLDKDLNTFAMRVREWYSWHFPELYTIVPDSLQFAQCCRMIANKSTLTAPATSESLVERLGEVLEDGDRAKTIVEAAKMSMGTDISPIDLINIEQFASRVIELGLYRKSLHAYLISKMNLCAPNLSALIGEQVGARLISHAGSLTNLAKYPASTVQILGAEKALFRALKTKGNTPKYGLIYHSTFIGRAATKNKGRISRYLANKCSLASRIDSFSEGATNVYGSKLREQVEERLEFYKTGAAPKKNIDVMGEAVKLDAAQREHEEAVGGDGTEKDKSGKKKKKDKKRESAAPAAASPPPESMDVDGEAEQEGEKKKSKKDKKRKAEEEPVAEEEEQETKKSKKDKKKDKKSSKD